MGEWPAGLGASRLEQPGVVAASSRHTLITAGAVNTKGSYTQLTAATTYPADGVTVCLSPNGGGSFLVDIAVGAAASETVIIPNLMIARATQQLAESVYLPVKIPAGVRLAARAQCSTASSGITVGVLLHASPGARWGFPGAGIVTDYGTLTGTSKGTDVDPGGVAHTKGSWVQLTASTTYPIRHLALAFGMAADIGRAAAQRHLFDIGIGAAASETVVVPDVAVSADPGTDQPSPMFMSLPVSIPAGVRVAARQQCSVTTAGDRILDVAAYGVS